MGPRRSRTLFSRFQVLALMLLSSVICLAQVTSGGLRVQVLDPVGQPVPNATVKITNLSTQAVREQQTGADGVTTFVDLASAQYMIEVAVRNVGTRKKPVTVNPGITAEETIELVQSESKIAGFMAVAGLTVEEREQGDPLNDLPNLNNDLSSFLRVAPGALAGNPAALGKIVIDGRGKEQQTLRLDGLDITPLTDLPAGDPLLGVLDTLLKPNVALDGSQTDTLAGALAIKPSQFSDTQTYEVSPLYGPGTGILVQGVSYPGPYLGDAKAWNITFYDSFRNDALNAPNFFDSEGKNGLRRNLFGLKFGEPIKKRLFTFFAYDGIRARVERPVYEAVPIDAQCNCGQGPLARFMGFYLPSGTTVVPGTSQNADFITARRLSRSVSDSDSFDARFDVAPLPLSSTIKMDSFYVRFTNQSARFQVPDGVTGRRQRQSLSLVSGVAGLRLVSSNFIHQFRFGINQNRSAIDINSPYSAFPELSQSLVTVGSSIPVKGLPGQSDAIPLTIPTASLGGLSKSVGRGFKQKPTSFNVSYDLSRLFDRHSIDAGLEARFVSFSFDKFGGLTYAFSDASSLRTGVAGTVNFLSDLSGAAPFSSGSGPRHVSQQNYLSYFQVTSLFTKFTIRWGLRYDYFGPITERDDRAVIVDPSTGRSLTSTASFFKTDKLNFQPRVGIEYHKSSFALRAGAGIYSGLPRIADLVLPVESDRFNSGVKDGTFPFATSEIVRGFVSNDQTRQFQPLSFARDFKVPERIYRWDAMLTRTIDGAFDLNVLYSGNIGRRLPVAGISNQIVSVQTNPDPTQPAIVVRQFDTVQNGEVFKPLGELLFRSSTGRSSYNGLTIQFRRNRMKLPATGTWGWLDWKNFRSLNAQYTLSRNVGNASGAVVSVPNDFDSDFGFNAADARHTFSFSTSYRFWKKGDRPQNGRWGWTISPVITARSGLPLIIRLDRPDVVYVDSSGNVFGGPAVGRTALINTPGGGATGGARVPNIIPGANPFSHNGIIFLNPAAFAIPKPGEFGNLKRGQLRGPAAFQADLGITRTLFQTSTENKAFLSELKVEIFNLFNRKNFASPPVTLPNVLGTSATGDRIQPGVPFNRLAAGSFGVINAADPGRTIQFTLSLRFNDGY